MSSPFVDELMKADLEVDRHFAEGFAFIPMQVVINGKPVRDYHRAVRSDVQGVFDNNSHRLTAAGATSRVLTLPGASFRVELLPEGVREYDRFIRNATGQLYEAVQPRPDGQGRVVVPMRSIAPAAPSPGVSAP